MFTTDAEEPIANVEATGRAGVTVDGTPLTAQANARLLRVVVDNDIRLPGMFELTFLDLHGQVLSDVGIVIGSAVTVSGAGQGGTAVPLIVGEVTAIEGVVQGITMRTVVRGYTVAHRLQRTRRSRSFLNVTDADVVKQVVSEAGLQAGTITPTTTTHTYLAQVNQTDWEFLSARAREIGFELGVADGKVFFRPVNETATTAGSPVPVRFPTDLISFRPRITAGNLTPDVEVRVWDPMARQAFAETSTTPAGASPSPNSLGEQFVSGGGLASSVASGLSAVGSAVQSGLAGATGGVLGSPIGYLGPPASPTAHIVVDRPFADQAGMATAGPAVAAALGSDHGSTFAEAEGEVKGNPGIQPGGRVDIVGVQKIFAGTWQVSRARHIFDDSEYGYRVVFSAHGRQDRTVLGLTSNAGRRSERRGVLDGVVCGVVSNGADPLGKGRVKVTLPWLSPEFETDWAPISQNYSAQRGGAIYMPEIGDEVLVAFEFSDVRRPYVLGAFMNNLTEWSIAKSGPVGANGLASINEVLVGQGIALAGAAAGALIAGPALAPLGAVVGSMVADAAYAEANAAVQSEISGAQLAPGMVSEVHHRGVVSNTGNSLLFYDVPAPLQAPSQADVAAATGASSGSGGGTGATDGSLTHPGMGALGSAVRLGSQQGEFGLTVDQVNGGVTLNAKPIPGVTLNPVPAINISTENGFLNIASGEMGAVQVDGGLLVNISSSVAITLNAPTVDVIGLLTVNGVPVPL